MEGNGRNHPRVSVVTVVFNDASRVEKTLSSVSRQDYPNLEYVIVDGGSTDGTLELIRNHECQVDRISSEKDRGIYDAMNKGATLASGEWVMFLNAGDSFPENSVLRSIFRQGAPTADVIYGSHLNDYGTYTVLSVPRPLTEMRTTLPFCHQASFVRRRLLLSRPFNLHYRVIADYDFFREVYFAGRIFWRTDVVIAQYSCTEGFSAEQLVRVYWENFKITADLPLIPRIAALARKVVRSRLAMLAKRILPEAVVQKVRERARNE